jgi:hypothetical protein
VVLSLVEVSKTKEFAVSHLKAMMEKLRRLSRRQKALKAAIQEIRDEFQPGERAEFDPGDARLLGCTVVATSDEFVIVEPDLPPSEIPNLFWKAFNGNIYVPFACAFTREAAAEMHAVRDPVLDELGR